MIQIFHRNILDPPSSPSPIPTRHVRRRAARLKLKRLARRVHRDQGGSISLASVFGLLLLVMLLGMVMNSSRQIDQKVKMQNAADASATAGGVVFARNMNTLAFTNHLLSDVFALTAFMREAHERSASSFAPEILDNWERMGPFLATADYPPFAAAGQAIVEKVPGERQMVSTFSDWASASADAMRPVLEDILANEQIPQFQRALVQTSPELVQFAADEVARRHGQSWPHQPQLHGVMWRTMADPVGGQSESQARSLPVVDPVMDSQPNQQEYMQHARNDRDRLAYIYLDHWNREQLREYDSVDGRMSQFANLWRIFTCGQLKNLLENEYPDRNLPFQIRTSTDQITDPGQHLEQQFMFVGVVYREKLRNYIPGVFKNPMPSDTVAYSQVSVFVPRRRLVQLWIPNNPSAPWGSRHLTLPVGRQSRGWFPEHWDLVNQNWTTQLTPGTAPCIPAILSTPPNINNVSTSQLPDRKSVV